LQVGLSLEQAMGVAVGGNEVATGYVITGE
jgi:hypothetical protein